MEEIEVKFMDIDAEKMEEKLMGLGAVKKYARVFRDKVFDFPGFPLDKNKSWVRLRDKGDEVKLAFKRRFGKSEAGDEGMEEIEVKVDDFEKTSAILFNIGMIQKYWAEKRRVHFEWKGAEIDIDTYPLIPPLMEIESDSWEKVKETAKNLGLDWERRKQFSATQVYDAYGIKQFDYTVLTFKKQERRHG